LIRWPIVVGVILLAAQIALLVAGVASTARTQPSGAPYVLSARDAGFTATFPGQPQRIANTVASGPVVLYMSSRPDESVGVAYFQVTSPSDFSLDGAINGAATSLTNGKVVSHSTVSYRGKPAEDGVMSFQGGTGNVRAVVIGSAVYLFEGFGPSASSFTRDYNVLLDTFTLTSPPAPSTSRSHAGAPTSPTNSGPAGILGSKVVTAPSGFSLFQGSGVQNGPLTAAGFDSFVAAPGAAAQLHFVTGYEVNYGDGQSGDVINVVLLEFATATEAANFEGAFTLNGVRPSGDPALPGAERYDSTTATAGSYEHGVVAIKKALVMVVDYASGSAARPTLIDGLAAEQYARM
jgi:hypothetical protein